MTALALFCDLCDVAMRCTAITTLCSRCRTQAATALWSRPLTTSELRTAAMRAGLDLTGSDLTYRLRQQVNA